MTEQCPKCGGVLMDLFLTSHPPIHVRQCSECGFEEVVERISITQLGNQIVQDGPHFKHDAPERGNCGLLRTMGRKVLSRFNKIAKK